MRHVVSGRNATIYLYAACFSSLVIFAILLLCLAAVEFTQPVRQAAEEQLYNFDQVTHAYKYAQAMPK